MSDEQLVSDLKPLVRIFLAEGGKNVFQTGLNNKKKASSHVKNLMVRQAL